MTQSLWFLGTPVRIVSFARLIAAVSTVDEADVPDVVLFERLSAEIGDEFLGPPGTLPSWVHPI